MLRLHFALICVCDEVAFVCCVCRLSASINVHFARLPFVSVGDSVVVYTSVCLCVAVCVCVCVRLWLLVTVYACGAVIFSGSQAVVRMSVGIQFVPSLPFLFLFVCVCVCVWGEVVLVCVYDESCSVCCINQFLLCSACSVPLGCLFLVLNVYRCVINVCVSVRVRVRVCVCGWRRLSSSKTSQALSSHLT